MWKGVLRGAGPASLGKRVALSTVLSQQVRGVSSSAAGLEYCPHCAEEGKGRGPELPRS